MARREWPLCIFCNTKATHAIQWDCGEQWHSVTHDKDYQCSNHQRFYVCAWCRELAQRITEGSFFETRIAPPERYSHMDKMSPESVLKGVEEILRDAGPPFKRG